MSDVSQPIPAAALSWGVKESFRSYVEAMGGTIALSGPVERGEDGGFVFAGGGEAALTRGEDGRPQGQAQFKGEVRFEAHGGMLKVTVADPGVEIGPDGGALTITDPWEPAKRLTIAKLEVSTLDPGANEIELPAKATIDGMQVLGDHYPPGTLLDPVRLKLAR